MSRQLNQERVSQGGSDRSCPVLPCLRGQRQPATSLPCFREVFLDAGLPTTWFLQWVPQVSAGTLSGLGPKLSRT